MYFCPTIFAACSTVTHLYLRISLSLSISYAVNPLFSHELVHSQTHTSLFYSFPLFLVQPYHLIVFSFLLLHLPSLLLFTNTIQHFNSFIPHYITSLYVLIALKVIHLYLILHLRFLKFCYILLQACLFCYILKF